MVCLYLLWMMYQSMVSVSRDPADVVVIVAPRSA